MMGRRAIALALWMLAACEIQVAQRADDDLTQPACGNAIVEGSEVCDDGNTVDGDGCNAACDSDETCGNGVIDEAALETCDDGNLLGGDGCSDDCKSDETCGNGVIDLAKGETCDDGNLQAGDGCSANCQSNESCGNSITDSGSSPPEECDAGPTGSAECDVNCTTAFCGDFTVNTLRGETCDAGPSGSAQCDTNCTAAVCGDGTTNTLRGEQCDDANSSNTDACVNCKNAFCGDGFIRAGVEQCDGGAGCNSSCKFDPRSFTIDVGSLLNQDTFCDATGENRYDGCNGLPYGFQWTDNSPFTPATIKIEMDRGIDCFTFYFTSTQYTITGRLNGVPSTITLTSDAGACSCTPTEILHTFTISAAGYNPNGINQFLIDGTQNPQAPGSGICSGISFDPGLNGYARVTTFPP